MRLPTGLWPVLRLLRRLAAAVQRWPDPPRAVAGPARGEALRLTAHPLPQPDRTSCGSSVIVMVRMLADPAYAARLLDAPDPAAAFGAEALAARRRTNRWYDRFNHLQLPWPPALGTRPAALVRELGGGLVNRVVDPARPGRAYDAIVAAGRPVVLFIGEGSWMQHIVLVTEATADDLQLYDPACGQVVTRTRAAFTSFRLGVAGWDQPWLVLLPA